MSEPSARSPGRRLREARERRNLPAARVAEQLRLEAHLLEAIEADRFEELGAAVYARGHIRKYAALVGLPAEELLSAFAESGTGATAPSLIPAASARDLSTAPRRSPLPWLGLCALVAVVAALWWWLGDAPEVAIDAGSAAPAATAEQEQVAALNQAQAAADLPTADAGADADTPTGGDESVAAAAGTIPRADRAAAPAAAATAASAPGPTGALRLEARFSSQSWFEVYDASGRRVTFELVPGGERRAVRATPPLRVLLGNAASANLSFAGRALRIPPELVVADTAWIQIDANGAIEAAAPRRVDSGSE